MPISRVSEELDEFRSEILRMNPDAKIINSSRECKVEDLKVFLDMGLIAGTGNGDIVWA